MGFFSEYKSVNKLLSQKKQVIVYSESRHYFQYFEKLLNDLLEKNVEICYLTSDRNDPLLVKSNSKMEVVYVKLMLGFLFSKIKADVMIMTMPDLGNFLFKRSPGIGKYVYVFHAAVSTHQQYRTAAFYNYDTIFCTGQYQQHEIRIAEDLYKQPSKEIIKYGYPLLDEISSKQAIENIKPTILIAPSWFEGCILEICIEELLLQLSKLPYLIILRSHPEYEKRKKKNFKKVQQLVNSYSNMTIDTLPNVIDRLPSTDILITDRSGIALEFAFGTGKPVLFIETVLKQTNAEWGKLNIEPIENSIRSKIGLSILPAELNRLEEKIKELKNLSVGFADKMQQLKKDTFYNSTDSYKAGVEYIIGNIKK